MVYYVCCGEMSERSKVKVSKASYLCVNIEAYTIDLTCFRKTSPKI